MRGGTSRITTAVWQPPSWPMQLPRWELESFEDAGASGPTSAPSSLRRFFATLLSAATDYGGGG